MGNAVKSCLFIKNRFDLFRDLRMKSRYLTLLLILLFSAFSLDVFSKDNYSEALIKILQVIGYFTKCKIDQGAIFRAKIDHD